MNAKLWVLNKMGYCIALIGAYAVYLSVRVKNWEREEANRALIGNLATQVDLTRKYRRDWGATTTGSSQQNLDFMVVPCVTYDGPNPHRGRLGRGRTRRCKSGKRKSTSASRRSS